MGEGPPGGAWELQSRPRASCQCTQCQSQLADYLSSVVHMLLLAGSARHCISFAQVTLTTFAGDVMLQHATHSYWGSHSRTNETSSYMAAYE